MAPVRPWLAGAADLVRRGIQARFRSGIRWLAGTGWPDAVAICSVAVPVILAGYFTAGWLRHVIAGILSGYAYANPVHVQVESALVMLARAGTGRLGPDHRVRLAAGLCLHLWDIRLGSVDLARRQGLHQLRARPPARGRRASVAIRNT